MNTVAKVLSSSVLMLAAGFAQAATIDFETDGAGNALSAGDVVGASSFTAKGITFSTTAKTKDGKQNANLMIFDTANPTGDDRDLRTPGSHSTNTVARGNVLIISEDNNSANPDDHAGGGSIFVDFDGLYGVKSIGLLDIEHSGSYVKLFDGRNNLIVKKDASAEGDNSWQELVFNQRNVASMQIFLGTSGAITNLSYVAPAPAVTAAEPGLLGMMLLGLSGVFAARRRQSA